MGTVMGMGTVTDTGTVMDTTMTWRRTLSSPPAAHQGERSITIQKLPIANQTIATAPAFSCSCSRPKHVVRFIMACSSIGRRRPWVNQASQKLDSFHPLNWAPSVHAAPPHRWLVAFCSGFDGSVVFRQSRSIPTSSHATNAFTPCYLKRCGQFVASVLHACVPDRLQLPNPIQKSYQRD